MDSLHMTGMARNHRIPPRAAWLDWVRRNRLQQHQSSVATPNLNPRKRHQPTRRVVLARRTFEVLPRVGDAEALDAFLVPFGTMVVTRIVCSSRASFSSTTAAATAAGSQVDRGPIEDRELFVQRQPRFELGGMRVGKETGSGRSASQPDGAYGDQWTRVGAK